VKRDLFVFDLDGTLVDSFGHYFASLERVFDEFGEALGVAFTEKLHYPSLTEPLPKFLRDNLGIARADGAMQRLREFSVDDAKTIMPFPGVVPLLDTLKARGKKLAIWTNRDFPSASLIVQHSGLKPYFDAFISGSCVKDKKPNPEGMGKILAQLGVASEGVVMVGDHEHDVWAAKGASVKAVRASWHTYWEINRCEEADHQFYRVDDFTSWSTND